LPLKTKHRGPAPQQTNTATNDILDEVLDYFRANVLFRNFPIEGPADRTLIYLTLFVSKLLVALDRVTSKSEAEKKARDIAQETFLVPGDAGFVLGGLIPSGSPAERDLWKSYMAQCRMELVDRLMQRAFTDQGPNKWWLCFNKRKFLGMTLTK